MSRKSIDPKLAGAVLQYVKLASTVTNKALTELEQHRKSAQEAQEARSAVGGTVEALIDADALGPHQKEAAERRLSTHAGALALLKTAAARIKELQMQQTKAAGDVNGPGSPDTSDDAPPRFRALGERTSEKTAADRELFRQLGIG